MTISRPFGGYSALVIATVIAVLSPGNSRAISVRPSSGRYDADFIRAYQPCTAPNTTTSNGIPACSPAVTSACGFATGGINMRPRSHVNEINVDADVNNVTGPGSCATGPYTLVFSLRMSFDDAACTSGSCTLLDVPVSVPLLQHGNDFQRLDFALESFFPAAPTAVSSYQVLNAVVMAPDGLPMATVGADDGPTDIRTGLGVAYEECTAPDTANSWGVPACSAPVWASPCDFRSVVVRLVSLTAGPLLSVSSSDLIGAPPDCADGTYTMLPEMRITTDDCGSLCTLPDVFLPYPVVVERGSVESSSAILSTNFVLSFLTDDDNVELRGFTFYDPFGNLLAAPAISATLPLGKAKASVSFHQSGNPTDDGAVIQGGFPHPPLDPTVGGATFTVVDKNGLVYTATIPAGAWEVQTPAKKWRYKDDLGTIAGVRRAEIREFRRRGSPVGFKTRVLVKETPLTGADLPAAEVTVSVSDIGGVTRIATGATICKLTPNRVSCK